jgi:tight adherence protein C
LERSILILSSSIVVGSIVYCLLTVFDRKRALEHRLERTVEKERRKDSFLKRQISKFSPDQYVQDLNAKLKVIGGLNLPLAKVDSGIDYLVYKVALTSLIVVLVLIYEAFYQRWWVVVLVASVLAWILPDQFLKQKLRQKREQILNELPGVAEIIAMAMEAGLTFDSAVNYVIEHYRGAVRDLLAQARLKIEAGLRKSEAFREMVEVSGSEEMKLLIRTILQAERQGRPIKDVLLSMAQAMRIKQRHQIEAKANRLPTTMLVPIFVFIIPPILLIYTLPALLNLRYLF